MSLCTKLRTYLTVLRQTSPQNSGLLSTWPSKMPLVLKRLSTL